MRFQPYPFDLSSESSSIFLSLRRFLSYTFFSDIFACLRTYRFRIRFFPCLFPFKLFQVIDLLFPQKSYMPPICSFIRLCLNSYTLLTMPSRNPCREIPGWVCRHILSELASVYLGSHIQVVSGLVQDQKVCVREEALPGQASTFLHREYFYFLIDLVAAKRNAPSISRIFDWYLLWQHNR